MTSPAAPSTTAPAATGDALRYPIGRLTMPERFDAAWRAQAIQAVADAPARLAQAVAGLSDAQLETPYRPGGWTIRQVVHHVADSHVNAYVRFKLALTEEVPTIRAYEEARWAELEDVRRVPIEISLELLDALHTRWVALLQAMTEEQWQRRLIHPVNGERTLDQMLATYAWHGAHHVAHVDLARRAAGA